MGVTEVGLTMEDSLTASNFGYVCPGQRVIVLYKLFNRLLIYSVLALSFDSLGGFSSSAGLSAHLFEACFLKHCKGALQQFKDHPL